MKVLLINPPAENEIIGNDPEIIKEEQGCYPPLGLLYIASYLKDNTKHEVDVLDAQAEKIGYAEIEKIIQLRDPDVVGITAMTFTLIDVIKTVQIVKEVNKEIKVILGGPHVHIYPDETIGIPGVDFLVLGEGEVAFSKLIENIDNPDNFKNIGGVVFRYKGSIVNTGVRDLIGNLDELPLPDRYLTPYKKYYSLLARRSPITTMFTSRGCPFQCTFCDRPHLGKTFRYRSAKNVVDEMEDCADMGIHEFLVYDDTFTVHRKRVLAICDEIIRRKLDVGWDIRSRVDTVDQEMLRELNRAGCSGIHYGVEAGTEKILKVLNKKINISRVDEVFRMTKKQGMQVLAYFMIGCPTETKEDILKTFEVAKALRPDYIHLTIFTPFPATRIYLDGIDSGIIKKDYWREFARNPYKEFVPPHWKEVFTREELFDLLKIGYKGFYTRPTYILKSLSRMRSWGELKRKVKAGLKVIGM